MTCKLALEKAVGFIESLTREPLLLPDDIEMTLGDVQRHARIELSSIHKLLAPSPAPKTAGGKPTDTELLDALAANSWDLRSHSAAIADTGDFDIVWTVTEHHMAPPCEREISRSYNDDPREAIRRAMRQTDPKAERCVSCDEVLHDGESVFYEHGEGGHIHSWCASDDPTDFVDEDEAPLKPGSERPKPFAYRLDRAAAPEADHG